MSRRHLYSTAEIQEYVFPVFDAIVHYSICTAQQLGAVAEWNGVNLHLTPTDVSRRLAYIRENADTLGWTIPWVPKGPKPGAGPYYYIAKPNGHPLTAADRATIRAGHRAQLHAMQTTSRRSSKQMSHMPGRTPKQKWYNNQMAMVYQGLTAAAALAEDALEK